MTSISETIRKEPKPGALGDDENFQAGNSKCLAAAGLARAVVSGTPVPKISWNLKLNIIYNIYVRPIRSNEKKKEKKKKLSLREYNNYAYFIYTYTHNLVFNKFFVFLFFPLVNFKILFDLCYISYFWINYSSFVFLARFRFFLSFTKCEYFASRKSLLYTDFYTLYILYNGYIFNSYVTIRCTVLTFFFLYIYIHDFFVLFCLLFIHYLFGKFLPSINYI